MKTLLAGLIIILFTLCAIAVKILGIATVIAFVLALIGLFGVEMSTAINLLMITIGVGILLAVLMVIIKMLALRWRILYDNKEN